MAQKHLRELLLEDQEPFLLSHYIADRRCQIKRSSPRTHLQVKKQKPISKSQSSASNFNKNSCFLSVHESPEPRKSPVFDFLSTSKSPNRVFIHIPARTSSLLLEAAVRIQKQSKKNSKSKPENRANRFGLFGSVLKRLARRDRARKPEIGGASVNEKALFKEEERRRAPEQRASETDFSRSCRYKHKSGSAVWSESDKDDSSLDCEFDGSNNGQRENFKDIDELAFEIAEAGDFDYCETRCCKTPFRFAVQPSPVSHGHHAPNITSPAASPSHHTAEDKNIYEIDSSENLQEEEERDKEQCSPVSVLDPPFDDNGQVDDQVEDDEYEGFDLKRSYEIVQRGKQRLLKKLCRFEQLAGLDPVELEKRMSEHEQENNSDDDYDEVSLSELIAEEEKRKIISKCVWKKLSSWKVIDDKSINTTMEQDIKNDIDDWKRNQDQVQETALEIELAVFGLLVEELSEELV